MFEEEMKEIARIALGVDRYSEENDPMLGKQEDLIKEILSDFNKKYPKLHIEIKKTITGMHVHVFIKNTTVKQVFDDIASKIPNLTGLGLNGFEEVSVQDANAFGVTAQTVDNSVYLTYTMEWDMETIVLEQKGDMVEMPYEVKAIANPLTPQFQLLSHYAREVNEDVEFLEKCQTLGFVDIEDAALFEWEDEFYPKMLY